MSPKKTPPKKPTKAKPKAKASPKKARKRTTKHTKLEAPPATKGSEGPVDILEMFEEQLVSLRNLQQAANIQIAKGGMSPTFVREARDISKAFASVITEKRKYEKGVRDEIGNLSPEQTHMLVAEYLREIDYDGRKIFRDIIIELDGEKSLLG